MPSTGPGTWEMVPECPLPLLPAGNTLWLISQSLDSSRMSLRFTTTSRPVLFLSPSLGVLPQCLLLAEPLVTSLALFGDLSSHIPHWLSCLRLGFAYSVQASFTSTGHWWRLRPSSFPHLQQVLRGVWWNPSLSVFVKFWNPHWRPPGLGGTSVSGSV